jgi:hypothetical protein
MRIPILWLSTIVFLACGACGSSGSSGPSTAPADVVGAPPGGSAGGGQFGGLDQTPAAPNDTGCSDAAKLVYVVSLQRDLFSFLPTTGVFTSIGKVDCPTQAWPNSMAVDRHGTAWLSTSDGALFKVSTADASCQPTAFEVGQHGFTKLGMGFATSGPGATDETLYATGYDVDLFNGGVTGQGLATIDLTTMKLTPIADYSGSLGKMGASLTGTGDGRLFGFFTTSPDATLAQIAGANAATTGETSLAGVKTKGQVYGQYAFAFWGGDFWFFTTKDQMSVAVTRLAKSGDGSLSDIPNTGGYYTIVGAGVSTCAPTQPPPLK